MKSRTFVMVKPDATERGLVGAILHRFEQDGFRILALSYRDRLSKEEAEFLYEEHKDKAHFPDLVAYTTSGPVALVAFEREDAPAAGRLLVGVSNPEKADAGTIRREFGRDFRRNSVHASDGEGAAARELFFFFPGLTPA